MLNPYTPAPVVHAHAHAHVLRVNACIPSGHVAAGDACIHPIHPISHTPHIPYTHIRASPDTPYTGIPGNRGPDGIPLNGVPGIGPKPHSYIDAPDGHTRDLAHMGPPNRAPNRGPNTPILAPPGGPLWLEYIKGLNGHTRDLGLFTPPK